MTEQLVSLDHIETLVDGLDHPEGVAWGPDGAIYAGGELGQIYRVELDGSYRQIASTGGFVLGLCLDADAAIYACDIRRHALLRITQAGEVTVYSAGAPARRFRNPNYPVFDRHGNLYVSDSGSWLADDGCLLRIRPGGETELLNESVRYFPNGMALSPDERFLYVACSTTVPGVVRLPIRSDGSLGMPEPVVELPRTVPDGLAFDAAGNLLISCYAPNAIYRLSAGGELTLFVEDWRATTIAAPTNIAFCGQGLHTLVIASLSRWHLSRCAMELPGAPLQYPRL